MMGYKIILNLLSVLFSYNYPGTVECSQKSVLTKEILLATPVHYSDSICSIKGTLIYTLCWSQHVCSFLLEDFIHTVHFCIFVLHFCICIFVNRDDEA